MSTSFQIPRILLCILVMAVVTYLPRVLPLAVFRKKIVNRWVCSFLAYMPYAVLAAMTFPEVFYSTQGPISATVGCAAALLLAFFRRSLLTVAAGGAAAVFLTEWVLRMIG